MRILHRYCAVASLAALLALPVIVCAEEGVNYDSDARQAESTPPMIPHKFRDTAGGDFCLNCHGTGINDAPITPHPNRLNCTGCHGQGEIKDLNPPQKN